MSTGRPTGDYDGPRNTMLGALRVEPVERCSQLVRDLRQARIRGKRIARQRRRPAPRQSTLGEAGKYLLTAALPITAVNVNETRRFSIGGGVQVPLGPISWSISQIEVLRALLAENLRGCGPVVDFLPSDFGSHMRHVMVGQIARLKRHGLPVHAGFRDFLCTKDSRGYDTCCSRSHESATVKSGHDDPPDP